MRFDAPTLAHAWLAVFQAAGTDKAWDPPQLYKAVAVEEHTHGVRLVATDRRLLLSVWVPASGWEHDVEGPHVSEVPTRVVVCSDTDGRARGLLGYVCALQNRLEDHLRNQPGMIEIDLTFDVTLPPGMLGEPETFESMAPTFTVLDVPDTERVYLPVVEAVFPDWRHIVDGFTGRKADRIAMSPDVLERLTKVRKHAEGPLAWRFGGRDKAAFVDYPDSVPYVSGVFMPRKLDVPGHHDPDPETGDCPVCASDAVCLAHTSGVVTIGGLSAEQEPDDIDVELMVEAIELVVATQFPSPSMLQRKLRVGYAAARRLLESMELLGVVGPTDPDDPSRPREVLTRPGDEGPILDLVRAVGDIPDDVTASVQLAANPGEPPGD